MILSYTKNIRMNNIDNENLEEDFMNKYIKMSWKYALLVKNYDNKYSEYLELKDNLIKNEYKKNLTYAEALYNINFNTSFQNKWNECNIMKNIYKKFENDYIHIYINYMDYYY